MRILVTRPAPGGKETAARLIARGHAPIWAPLFEATPMAPADGAGKAWQEVLFTSAAAARAAPESLVARHIPALAVGEATLAAARGAGFACVEAAGGDAEALLALAKARLAPGGGPVLHASGETVTLDLAAALRGLGFEAERVIVYRMRPIPLSPAARAALQAGALDAVSFYNAESAGAFAALADPAWPLPQAHCLSPAIAARLAALPWREVRIADRPEEAAMLDLADLG